MRREKEKRKRKKEKRKGKREKRNGEKEKKNGKKEKGKGEKGGERAPAAIACAVGRDVQDEGEQMDVTAGFRCQDRVLRKIGRSGGKMVRAQRRKTFEKDFSA